MTGWRCQDASWAIEFVVAVLSIEYVVLLIITAL